jgi:hypothetical protein
MVLYYSKNDVGPTYFVGKVFHFIVICLKLNTMLVFPIYRIM